MLPVAWFASASLFDHYILVTFRRRARELNVHVGRHRYMHGGQEILVLNLFIHPDYRVSIFDALSRDRL